MIIKGKLQARKLSTISVLLTSAAMVAMFVTPAQAAYTKTGYGTNGSSITLSRVTGLNPNGTDLYVTGKGFSTTAGIYLAMCVLVAPGTKPTPCGGGADMTGATGASIWISSNPPSYGVGIAKPFNKDGSFKIKVRASSMIGKIDCAKVKCAIYTRADHLRADDRTADIAVPITFARTGPAAAAFVPEPIASPTPTS